MINFAGWRDKIESCNTPGRHSRGEHDLFGVLLLPFFGPSLWSLLSLLFVGNIPDSVRIVHRKPRLIQGNNIFPMLATDQLQEAATSIQALLHLLVRQCVGPRLFPQLCTEVILQKPLDSTLRDLLSLSQLFEVGWIGFVGGSIDFSDEVLGKLWRKALGPQPFYRPRDSLTF
jgi:hypothetical protein